MITVRDLCALARSKALVDDVSVDSRRSCSMGTTDAFTIAVDGENSYFKNYLFKN
jgi:hypothetical protein